MHFFIKPNWHPKYIWIFEMLGKCERSMFFLQSVEQREAVDQHVD